MKGKINNQDYELCSHAFYNMVTGENPESYLKSQYGGMTTDNEKWDISMFVENLSDLLLQ